MAGSDLLAKLDRTRLKVHTRTQLGRVYAMDCMAVLAKMQRRWKRRID